MRLGISSYTFTWAIGVPGHFPETRLDTIGLLRYAVQLGASCVQIADNLPLHLLSNDQLEAASHYATRHGIAIEVGTRGLSPDHLYTYLAIAQRMKSPILRMVVDGKNCSPEPDEIVSVIRDCLPELERRKLVLAIENHDRFTARTFADIINRVGSERVGICLDSVNSMGAGEGIETVVEILGPLTVNWHIKDFRVRRVYHTMGFTIEGTPAGQGQLPVEEILRKLEAYQRCRSAILELWTPPEDSIARTVATEEQWAIESMNYLRPFFDR